MDAKRVLIVDDDPVFVKSAVAILESHGYLADSASGGQDALARMEQDKPELVILDVMMDWTLDGVDVSRIMMKRPELRDVPIIMVTSIRDSEYRGSFPLDEYLHIDSWLDKPCSPQTLLSEVDKVLERHAMYRSRAS